MRTSLTGRWMMNRISLIFAGLGLFLLGASLGWGATRLKGKDWKKRSNFTLTRVLPATVTMARERSLV